MRLDLRRVELATGNMRKTHSVNGATLFELADSGTARLAADFGRRRRTGRSPTSRRDRSGPTVSYGKGCARSTRTTSAGAERSFEAALAEDSTFAMAAYYSGAVGVRRSAVARQRFSRALGLRRYRRTASA